MRRLLFLGTLLLVLLLVACVGNSPTAVSTLTTKTPSPTRTPIPTVVEPGLAYGEPCKPPCWRGLIPGQSTSSDVAKVIEQLKTSGWANEVVGGPHGFVAYPSPFTTRGTVGLLVVSGTVAHISGDLLFSYTLNDMVDQFGDPEAVYMPIGNVPRKSSCLEQEGGDPTQSGYRSDPVYFLYPGQGIAFFALVPQADGDLLCPEMRIIAFVYHPPFSLPAGLKRDYLADLFANEGMKGITESDLLKWHGFGTGY